MRTSADSSQAERASLESCCSASSAHGTARTEAQRLGLLASFPPQTSNVALGVRAEDLRSPAMKMRTSADISQAERASLESCFSASSAHGSACPEAQRLGLLTCLATSKFKRSFGRPCRGPPVALLRKCERLQIAHSQTEPAWKDVAQPHLPMALLAHRHRDWGCLLVLPNQSSKVS